MPDTTVPSSENQKDSAAPVEAPVEESAGVTNSDEKSGESASEDVAARPASVEEKPEPLESEDTEEDDSGVEDSSRDTAKLLKTLRKKNSENKNLRDRLHAAEQKLNQFQVAAETGLPSDLADRLRGGSVEEMKDDAARLLELMGSRWGSVWQPPKDGLQRGPVGSQADDETDLVKIGERIYNP